MKKLSLALIIFVGSLAGLFTLNSLFSVHTITIEGIADLKGIEGYSGSFLPFLSEEKLEGELREANPILADIDVFKQYPDTLYVTARELRPIVTVKLADGFMYVSEAGTVLGKNRSEDHGSLPILTYYQPIFFNQMTIGDIVDHAEIVTAAQMTDQVLDLGIAVTKIDITNENMIVLHTDTFTVLVTSIKDVQQQFRVLDYTYTQLKREGKDFSRIDVRFEKPIIKL